MENVGAVTFSDKFLKDKSLETEGDNLYFMFVVLQKLSQMWFGNLVTHQWWNDLWLKKSFADYMAATCFLECEELSTYKNSDLLFINNLDRAL